MVQDAGAKKGPGGVRPLGLPQPIEVRTDERGWPMAVKLGRRWVPVTVEDRWRVNDEWWREERVARAYWQVRSEDVQALTILQDLTTGRWFQQDVGD